MVYSDLIFILGMFPIMTIISLFDRSAEYKNLILIVCSLLFFSWGRPFVFCLIFLSVILDWIFGLIISKNRENKALCGIFLVLDIIMNVSLMLIFGQNILYNKVKKLSFDAAILPLGMGYYMLRGISYVYDVFKGNCKAEKNIFCLLTYMVSLHFMLVGPLVRYGDIEPQSLIACIVQAADAISAARPGARRETIETYTNRLKQLEDITNEFKGVDKSFAIQAGREIRIMVVPELISDADMVLLARDISKKIEEELAYPGQIKVNVIRESRVTDYAK